MSNLNECLDAGRELAIFAIGFLLGFLSWSIAQNIGVLFQ